MANWNDFIQESKNSLGLSEGTARSATGGILQMVRKQAGEGDFSQLQEKIPGADRLLQDAPAGESEGSKGGMLGGIMGAASSALGGKGGSMLGLAAIASQSGLGDKVGPFASKFIDFVRSNAGEGIAAKLTEKIPDLKH
jgi:hypothetical protein